MGYPKATVLIKVPLLGSLYGQKIYGTWSPHLSAGGTTSPTLSPWLFMLFSRRYSPIPTCSLMADVTLSLTVNSPWSAAAPCCVAVSGIGMVAITGATAEACEDDPTVRAISEAMTVTGTKTAECLVMVGIFYKNCIEEYLSLYEENYATIYHNLGSGIVRLGNLSSLIIDNDKLPVLIALRGYQNPVVL